MRILHVPSLICIHLCLSAFICSAPSAAQPGPPKPGRVGGKSGGFLQNLSWSPDGKQIAFASARTGNFDIWVMNADGSDQRRLTTNPTMDCWPAWSPDGKRIAFTSNRDGNYEIYVMNADGTGQRNLTAHPAQDNYATWSPDGKRIAFISTRDGGHDIYVMDVD